MPKVKSNRFPLKVVGSDLGLSYFRSVVGVSVGIIEKKKCQRNRLRDK